MHSDVGKSSFEFDLSGGVLCLDFANTLSRRKTPEESTDHLRYYDDLIAFAEQTKILSPKQSKDLQARARRHGRSSEHALRRAISHRENIYRVFSALAEGKPAGSDDVQQITDFAVEALNHRQIERADGRYRWEWHWNGKKLPDRILWPIAQSAAELLTSSELDSVRICKVPDCAWLFLDRSRNHSRRWCDMRVCGNRQKARRHYRRSHQ